MAMNGVGTDHLVSIWSHLPLDVIALDWRSSIVMANERGVTQTVQGNLDPAYLFGDEKTLAREVDRILLEGIRYGRHIFNLGHGVFPEADPQKLHWLTDYVHERSRELWAQEG
jgi:uroporphyrinogen decarboxylase